MSVIKLWIASVALCASTAQWTRVSAVCDELRVPPAQFSHQLLYLDSRQDPPERAVSLVREWSVPAHNIPNFLRQILEAMDDMILHETSEVLVNMTLDHTLSYEIDLNDEQKRLEIMKLVPERPVNETVADFCERFSIFGSRCTKLYASVRTLVEKDWGCLDPDAPQQAASVLGEEQPLASVSVPSAITPLTTSLAINGSELLYTVREDQSIQLQGALLCRRFHASTQQCTALMKQLLQATRDHPSFHQPKSELELHLTSPRSGTHYPRSLRLYYEGFWRSSESHVDVTARTVCIFFDFGHHAKICGPFPPPDLMYTSAFKMPPGYHLILVTAPLSNTTELPTVDAEIPFIAAQEFWVVEPTVQLLSVGVETIENGSYLILRLRTTAFNPFDSHHRVCVRLNDAYDCFLPSIFHIETDKGVDQDRETVFRAAVFIPGPGPLSFTIMLTDLYGKAFAVADPKVFNVALGAAARLLPPDASTLFFSPSALPHQIKRPTHCPESITASNLTWICDLWRHEWGLFSQNGEDGVLQSILHHIGTTNKYYVEFGAENGDECNTRWLRQVDQWTGLLMDGQHAAKPEINLQHEWISPENINDLLAKYEVPPVFDLLSIDVDFNDYWILDAIDRQRFSPRVIVIEINSHIPPHEARTVKYNGPSQGWDGKTDYFGVSVAAVHLWGRRNGYALVYCESHGVNCFLVRDDALVAVAGDEAVLVSEVLSPADLHAPPNFFGRGARYPSNDEGEWVWLTV